MGRPRPLRRRSLLRALALPLALLLLFASAPCCLRAFAQSDADAGSDSASSALVSNSAGGAPPRALLFRPAFDGAGAGGAASSSSDSPSPAPFPSSGTRALDSPFPLHVSLDALGSARFSFGVLPSLPVGVALVGFDWRRNGTVGTLRPTITAQQQQGSSAAAASYGVEWGESLPSWLRYIAPSAGGGSGGTTTGAFDTVAASSSSPNSFTLEVTAPQSGDRNRLYASPAPVLLHLVALVQYQYPPPLHPADGDAQGQGQGGEEAAVSAAAAAAPSDASDGNSPSSSPSSSGSGASTPLVLIAEVQYASLLVSLTILPPFEQRVKEMSPFYTLLPSPNMLDPRNRLANVRSTHSTGGGGGGGGASRAQGLGSKKFSWRDEAVYTCAGARDHECALCTPEAPPSSSSSSTTSGSVAPFPLLCSFPAGSFVNVASGVLVVSAPLALQGLLQVNAGATLEFDHDLPAIASTTGRLVHGVSVVDCRDRLGRASPLVNEGLIVVRRGHVVVYSQMRGKGAIHVHAGGSIEFVSLQAHGSSSQASSGGSLGGGAGSSGGAVSAAPVPGVVYFNHTGILPDKSLSNLAGVSSGAAAVAAGGRHLLQLREENEDETGATAPSTELPRDETQADAALSHDLDAAPSSIGTGADSSVSIDTHPPSAPPSAALSGPVEPDVVPASNEPEHQPESESEPALPASPAAAATTVLTGTAAASTAGPNDDWDPLLPSIATAAATAAAAAAAEQDANVDASHVVSMVPPVATESVSSFEIAAAANTTTATTTSASSAASVNATSSDVAAAVQPSPSSPPWSLAPAPAATASHASPASSPASSVPAPSSVPSSTGQAPSAASNATSHASSATSSSSTATSSSSPAPVPSSSSPAPSSLPSSPPSPSSSGASVFVPHPSAILVCFGGGVLFSHGRFAFLAPFQSALPRLPPSSAAVGAGWGSNPRNQAYSRIVLTRHAEVVFFEPPVATTNASATGAVGWWGGSGSDSGGGGTARPNSTHPGSSPVPTLPPTHLLSGTHLSNSGLLRVSSSARLNISSLLFFHSSGLLRVEHTAVLVMDLSDDAALNRMEGVDGRSGAAPDEDQRARLGEVAAFLASAAATDAEDARADAEQPIALEDEQQSSESSEVDVAIAEADALLPADSAPLGPSASLSSLQSALASLSSSSSPSSPGLSSSSSSALAVRPSGGGVGLLLTDGATLSVRGGRLHLAGGLIAKDQSHLFIRRGVRWTVDVEPTVGPAWAVPRDDTANAALFVPSTSASTAASSSPSSSDAGTAGAGAGAGAATSSASHLHLSGVEFSLDGVLHLRRGHLVLETPLLQIEGHGQLQASGRAASILMDNSRTNGAIALAQAQILAGAFDPALGPDGERSADAWPEESVLEPNPLAATDPDAELYTFEPQSSSSQSSSSDEDKVALTPALPQLRENLVAPCVTTLRCQSLQLSDGARLQIAPLTTLHLLPRALAHVSSTVLEGGALVLDSAVEYRGRVLVSNLSEAASFEQGGGGGAISLPSIHIGNGSLVSMRAVTEPIVLAPDVAAAVAAGSPAASVTQLSSPLCVLATGNLTGNGVLQCGGDGGGGGGDGGGGGGDNTTVTDPGQAAAQLDPSSATATTAGFGTLLLDSVLVYPSFRSPSPFSPTVYTPPPSAQPQAQQTSTTAAANSTTPPPEVLPAPVLRFDCGVSMTPRTTTVLDIFGYHSISSLRVSGPATLDGALVLNASLHRWPFASDLGRSRPDRDRDGTGLRAQMRQLQAESRPQPSVPATAASRSSSVPASPSAGAAPFPILDRGMGLGGHTPGSRVPGDGSTSASASSQAQSQSQVSPSNAASTDSDASSSSSSNSSAATTANTTTIGNATTAPVPVPVAGRDQVLLLSARGGLQPAASPTHFASIQLGALFEVLPLGYTLDLQYLRSANDSELDGGDGGGGSVGARAAGAGPAPPPLQPETRLLLVAFGADYHTQPATHSSTTSAALATCPHPTHSLSWLALQLFAAVAFVCCFWSFDFI